MNLYEVLIAVEKDMDETSEVGLYEIHLKQDPNINMIVSSTDDSCAVRPVRRITIDRFDEYRAYLSKTLDTTWCDAEWVFRRVSVEYASEMIKAK